MKKLIGILCAALMVAALSGSTFEVESMPEQVIEIVCAVEIVEEETPVEPPEITPEIEYETETVEYQEPTPEVIPVAVVVPATTLPEPEKYIPVPMAPARASMLMSPVSGMSSRVVRAT